MCLHYVIYLEEWKRQEIFTECVTTEHQRKIAEFRKHLKIKKAACLLMAVSHLQLSMSFPRRPVNKNNMLIITTGYCKIQNNSQKLEGDTSLSAQLTTAVIVGCGSRENFDY